MIDRAEAGGLGVATAGHLALLAALSVGFAAAVKPPVLNEPMEVSFVDEIGLTSAAPVPSAEPPAPKLGQEEAPVEQSLPEPAPPEPMPLPQPKEVAPTPPRPAPAPKPKPAKPAPTQAKATPAKLKPAPKKPTAAVAKGRLDGLLAGLSDRETASRSTTPPARVASAAVQSSLGAEVRRQLKPHWKAPSGADVELLRTELRIVLAPNGAVTDVKVLQTTGQTASNRPQVKLHQEQAIKAVRLASPFRLPAEYYDSWKLLSPIRFDKRLSQ